MSAPRYVWPTRKVEVEFECEDGCGWQRVMVEDLGDRSTEAQCPDCHGWVTVEVPPYEPDPDR